MTEALARERILKLKAEIERLRFAYHVHNAPGVTDDVYESLMRELHALEEKFPQFAVSESLNRIAGKPLDKFRKVTHSSRMLSLQDAFGAEELYAWEKRVKKLLEGKPYRYFAELKLDGLAVNLRYEQGVFVQGATRGDGFVGEDITENIKVIGDIPLRLLPPYPQHIEVRGEVVMQKSVLERLNKEQEEKGLPKFANTRNAAAGSVRQLDPSIAQSRQLSFFAYDIAVLQGAQKIPEFHSEEHALLRELGFPVTSQECVAKTLPEIETFIAAIGEEREHLPYHIDGIVVQVDELSLHDRLGVVGKAPRYAVAFKYPAERATTMV
ncbi:MAG TPA: NAD-dependent DNA ligase LigA, partial [Candidatus Paceibacterota bacterium]|nr:NAD-dependent DNA ligase LigA [Candidatus Paceibacterota bacterium]